VGTLGIVEAEVVAETDPSLSSTLICFQIHLFVLHFPPQPFDEQVVIVAPLPIHTDSDSVLLQEPDEGLAGELGATGCVEKLLCGDVVSIAFYE